VYITTANEQQGEFNMAEEQNEAIKARVQRIKFLTGDDKGTNEYLEAGGLALTILSDTVGGAHALFAVLDNALKSKDWEGALAASRGIVTLYEQGSLKSPRLAIAHEIEGNLLDIAQAQAQAAEMNKDTNVRQFQLAIGAFLAGASLEDALRRLCDTQGIVYDVERTSISRLQSALYQPSKRIEVISASENKQITAWSDTRNKADHGRFNEITHTEVVAMILGIRAFLDKHLP
jgi:hypothetical protein